MKIFFLPLAMSLVLLAGCSSVPRANYSDAKHSPETVLITYHVKEGKEWELEQVLERAWKIYTAERLVFPNYPHTVLLDRNVAGKPRIIESFTWVSHSAPDNAPDSVKEIWNQMQALCEARDGHGGLEGGEVQMIGPKKW